ncbi:hypothetical protein K503DRAFT_853901 [Rhizopogon vinicolor AM-OR11-026]|uniref:Uncharacterized protein n=1 Tax=Rhizopogon vinicolor AM-OR11-026 TaxID=1314800 RepID=A0A1B7NCA1_9AGAM|nr:hypothetical protein K503DRAFT_853901 [Rhizopogon vinicolor AM-OR11-026]
MPGHRSLSLLQLDSSEVDSFSSASNIGLLSHASISKTIYKRAGLGTTESIPGPGPLKRRKTLGLNTRFDRMLAQVNVTHSYTSDQKTRRKRVRSSGSSSVSSYDLPKTPVDAYSHLREDRLGGDFTVLKMNRWESNPSKSPLLQHGPDIRVKTYGKVRYMRMIF